MEYIVTFFVLVLGLSYILSMSIVVNFLMLILAEILIYYTSFGEAYEFYLRVMSLQFIYNILLHALVRYVAKQNANETVLIVQGFFIPFLIMIIALILLRYTPFGKKRGLELALISAFCAAVVFLRTI
jgi:hypothetical protein